VTRTSEVTLLPKKVLIVYHYFAHYRLPIIKELAKDPDINYTFISGRTTNHDIKIISNSEMIENKVIWKEINNIWLFKKKFLWQSGLIRECLFGKYDSIIFLGTPYFLSTWFAAILVRLQGKLVYFWTHATVRNNSRDMLKTLFFKLANGLFLYGNWAKNRLISLGFNPEKLHVIYNSLDYETQILVREKLTSTMLLQKKKELFKNYDLPVLIFIGRIISRKKLDELIDACEKMHQLGMPINLLFVGDGDDRSRLGMLSESKNLQDYIVFYGETYNETELAPLIALSDVCVSPGEVGLTAIHSLTYGTPIITHDNPYEQGPEFEIITPGCTGMFFEYGKVESLVNVITEWLRNNSSKREQVRSNCYEIVEKFYNPAYQAKVIKSVILNSQMR